MSALVLRSALAFFAALACAAAYSVAWRSCSSALGILRSAHSYYLALKAKHGFCQTDLEIQIEL
jgi:hypothetical protein